MRQDQGRRDRRGRGAITIVLLALLMILPAAAQAARPAPAFYAEPVPARVGEVVTFTAIQPGIRDAQLTWDFGDGTGAQGGVTVEHVYESVGSRTVTLTVTRAAEPPQFVSGEVPVLGPTAAFAWTPAVPNAGEAVAFDASASGDPQGGLSGYTWDFGDGAGALGVTASHAFATPGDHTVTLVTTSALDGRLASAAQTLRVNAFPVAGFAASPASPQTGDVVTLTSTASDPDGAADLADIAWDLDGDGQFTEDSGGRAVVAFLRAGDYVISQRVTDRNGASATASQTVTVSGTPASTAPGSSGGEPVVVVPGPGEQALNEAGSSSTPGGSVSGAGTSGTTSGPRALRVLSTVRVQLAGTVAGTLTDITSFTVRGPSGTAFRIRCKGRGCPPKALRLRLARAGGRRVAKLHRTFGAGARLTVDATKSGYLPKRIVLTFRRGAPPARKEQCLWPGARKGQTRAAACPAS